MPHWQWCRLRATSRSPAPWPGVGKVVWGSSAWGVGIFFLKWGVGGCVFFGLFVDPFFGCLVRTGWERPVFFFARRR